MDRLSQDLASYVGYGREYGYSFLNILATPTGFCPTVAKRGLQARGLYEATLHCFLVVVMDSRNLLIYAMIMEFNGILNLTPRKVRLQLLVVTPLLCPSNWATLP